MTSAWSRRTASLNALASIAPPPVFGWIAGRGGVGEAEMARTFNCGIGMVLAVQPELAGEVVAELEEAGEDVVHVGEVAQGPRGCTVRGPAGSWGASETWEATHNA